MLKYFWIFWKDLVKELDKIQRKAARFVKKTAMAEQKALRNF
jgi:hypothetical protein